MSASGIWVRGTWTVVLAGGDGTGLNALSTTANGVVVPKQFCSLRGGPSFLEQALSRAGVVSPQLQTCVVVAAQQRWWWGRSVSALPRDNVLVQPQNRGTAHSVLLALLTLHAWDPHATVLLLPAGHVVSDEALLARSLRYIAELAALSDEWVYLLGTEPEAADVHLGYIIPASRVRAKPARVLSFFEAPDAGRAAGLIKAGALWNMFILAGSVRALLDLYRPLPGDTVARLRVAIGRKASSTLDGLGLDTVYRQLQPLDFSRDVLERDTTSLRVVGVPACGWTSLRTPQHVVDLLTRQPASSAAGWSPSVNSPVLNLADRVAAGPTLGSSPR